MVAGAASGATDHAFRAPASHERAADYQRMKEAMLGLGHDSELAPVDRSELERLEQAPRAVGEVEL